MKIVILGKGLMLANIILGASDAGAKIAGVLRYEQTSKNPFVLFIKDTLNPDYELTLMKRLRLKQLKFKSANSKEFRDFLIKENVDLVIIGTWKEKICKESFDIPTIGTINIHPSLLPKYRGPNPYMQTILHGEEYSGVTLHLVDKEYDTGAILSQEKIKILPTDTSKELKEKTVAAARKLICEFITDLNSKIVTPINQSEKNATYFKNISGEEKMLDFTKQSSDEISRTIRALHPFLPTYITYGKRFFIVNPYDFEILNEQYPQDRGTIIEKDVENRALTIICQDKKAIRFNNLKLYGGEIFTKIFIDKFVKIS